MSDSSLSSLGIEHFSIWGTSAAIATSDSTALPRARQLLDVVLEATSKSASRFDTNSEISQLNAAGTLSASPWFLELLVQARHGYELTDGLCDPTVLGALVALGYDRDFDAIVATDDAAPATMPAPGWSAIGIDDHLVTLAEGVTIDLGASAKAVAADASATAIAAELGCGVLVDLGGDLRIAGPAPAGGWPIGIAASAKHGLAAAEITEIVSLSMGGVASSSSMVRSWQRSGQRVHHIIDPRTGASALTPWTLVSVVAPTTLEANALSTAAIIWGEDAIFELAQRSAQARLVRHDGSIERVGGWAEPRGDDGS